MEHQVPAGAATNADVPTQARVVVIGGGIVGTSVAYHLTERGWTDVVLLERKRLTSGTTWHAAGLVGQIRATYNMTMLARYALELFAEVERRTGMGTGFRRTGSILLAATEGRLGGGPAQRRDGPAVRRGRRDDRRRPGYRDVPPARSGGGTGCRLDPGRRRGEPDRRDPGRRQGGPPGRGADPRAHEGHRRPRARRPRHRRLDRSRRHRLRVRRELHRHVGPRAGRPERRGDPEPRGRALLPDHRGDPGARSGPARAPLARRHGLHQGRHEQAHGRVLRAGRQALGDPRHPRGRRVRHPARGLGPHHAVPRAGGAARARPRRGRLPAPLQRARELHPRRPLRPGRGARAIAATSSRPGSTRSGSRAAAARAGRSPTGWWTTARRWTSGRWTSGGSCRSSATAAISTSGPPRRSACSTTCTGRSASTRPRAASGAPRSTTGSRRAGRASARCPAGSGRTGTRPPASSRATSTATAVRTGSRTAPRSTEPSGRTWRCSTRPRSASSWSRAAMQAGSSTP